MKNIAVPFAAMMFAVAVVGCGAAPAQQAATPEPVAVSVASAPSVAKDPPSLGASGPRMQDGVSIEDIRVGDGEEVHAGQQLSVHYVGTLTDGTTFDSSRDRKDPFQFEIGRGMVIAGWEKGLLGMRVGGVRALTIPPDLAYGKHGAGAKIPPDATLHFEVELLKIRH
jgi:FKBP-type peptidyl-prolyl cis-trans isomerase FkpA